MKRIELIIFSLIIGYSTSLFGSGEISLSRNNEKIYLDLNIPFKNLKEISKRLSSGLTNRVQISVQIKNKKDNKIIVDKNFLYEAIYDVWDEKYILNFFDPEKRFIFSTKNRDEILNLLLRPAKIELCDVGVLSYENRYQVKVKVLLNPVSREIINKINEYLSDPDLVQRESKSRTIFGSFANIFIPELNTENAIRFEIKSINLYEIPLRR